MMQQPDDVPNWDSGMAPDCEVEGSVSAPVSTDGLRGKLTPQAPLAKLVWFKTGGCADWPRFVASSARCLATGRPDRRGSQEIVNAARDFSRRVGAKRS